jgi:ferredoxin
MTQETPEREPEEYRFRWTKHPDAYPGLTHCPSCGEPVDVSWWDAEEEIGRGGHRPARPVRCEQCERDLRLPKYAVKDQLCLLCKVPQSEADEGVAYRRLETGERICSNCTGDLRAFKYELTAQHFVAEYISDEHRQAIIAALAEVADQYEGEYTFAFNANARYGRMEPDADEDLTVQDLIEGEADPEDLPDEVRQEVTTETEEADTDE